MIGICLNPIPRAAHAFAFICGGFRFNEHPVEIKLALTCPLFAGAALMPLFWYLNSHLISPILGGQDDDTRPSPLLQFTCGTQRPIPVEPQFGRARLSRAKKARAEGASALPKAAVERVARID